MSETKTHWKKLTNPDYLGSWDLDGMSELQVEITSVAQKMVKGMDGKEEQCIVASLKGHKPMILNATNCKTLSKIFDSPHIEDWRGKKAILVVEQVRAFGEIWDALRVKKIKVDQREKLTPNSSRWQGAVEALINGKCDLNLIKKNFQITAPDLKKLEEAINA